MPEVVAAGSAHAAIDKACDLLRIKLVHVPIDPVTCEMDLAAAAAAVNENTIMIYASAPNYPQGVIDPIPALSELALERGVGLHVDCCLGGFFLPFARKLRPGTIECFDFGNPGVTSISADTHKYGYATKGTSVVLYRNKALRAHQFFTFPTWQGGKYSTPSTPGSRPGLLSAATWTSMMRLGEEGYMDATERILQASEKLQAAIQRIDGIRLVGNPQAMVVAFASDSFNVYRVSAALGRRGYHLASCQYPPCVHLALTLRHTGETMTEIVGALEESVAEVQATPAPAEEEGVGIYGSEAPAGASAGELSGEREVGEVRTADRDSAALTGKRG